MSFEVPKNGKANLNELMSSLVGRIVGQYLNAHSLTVLSELNCGFSKSAFIEVEWKRQFIKRAEIWLTCSNQLLPLSIGENRTIELVKTTNLRKWWLGPSTKRSSLDRIESEELILGIPLNWCERWSVLGFLAIAKLKKFNHLHFSNVNVPNSNNMLKAKNIFSGFSETYEFTALAGAALYRSILKLDPVVQDTTLMILLQPIKAYIDRYAKLVEQFNFLNYDKKSHHLIQLNKDLNNDSFWDKDLSCSHGINSKCRCTKEFPLCELDDSWSTSMYSCYIRRIFELLMNTEMRLFPEHSVNLIRQFRQMQIIVSKTRNPERKYDDFHYEDDSQLTTLVCGAYGDIGCFTELAYHCCQKRVDRRYDDRRYRNYGRVTLFHCLYKFIQLVKPLYIFKFLEKHQTCFQNQKTQVNINPDKNNDKNNDNDNENKNNFNNENNNENNIINKNKVFIRHLYDIKEIDPLVASIKIAHQGFNSNNSNYNSNNSCFEKTKKIKTVFDIFEESQQLFGKQSLDKKQLVKGTSEKGDSLTIPLLDPPADPNLAWSFQSKKIEYNIKCTKHQVNAWDTECEQYSLTDIDDWQTLLLLNRPEPLEVAHFLASLFDKRNRNNELLWPHLTSSIQTIKKICRNLLSISPSQQSDIVFYKAALVLEILNFNQFEQNEKHNTEKNIEKRNVEKNIEKRNVEKNIEKQKIEKQNDDFFFNHFEYLREIGLWPFIKPFKGVIDSSTELLIRCGLHTCKMSFELSHPGWLLESIVDIKNPYDTRKINIDNDKTNKNNDKKDRLGMFFIGRKSCWEQMMTKITEEQQELLKMKMAPLNKEKTEQKGETNWIMLGPSPPSETYQTGWARYSRYFILVKDETNLEAKMRIETAKVFETQVMKETSQVKKYDENQWSFMRAIVYDFSDVAPVILERGVHTWLDYDTWSSRVQYLRTAKLEFCNRDLPTEEEAMKKLKSICISENIIYINHNHKQLIDIKLYGLVPRVNIESYNNYCYPGDEINGNIAFLKSKSLKSTSPTLSLKRKEEREWWPGKEKPLVPALHGKTQALNLEQDLLFANDSSDMLLNHYNNGETIHNEVYHL